MRPNSEYSILAPDGISVRVMNYQRRRIYERFLVETGIGEDETVLDVGASADSEYESSNPLLAWYPRKDRITATGVTDARVLETQHPGLKFVMGDGRELPFSDGEFDVVHSSAVLEHVGGPANQARFIGECARVARRAFFLTTPNRWFPVELHTALPVAHWLPKPAYRGLMRRIGQGFFAEESNLNLVGRGELSRIMKGVDLHRFEVTVKDMALAGWPCHLLIVGRARQAETIGA